MFVVDVGYRMLDVGPRCGIGISLRSMLDVVSRCSIPDKSGLRSMLGVLGGVVGGLGGVVVGRFIFSSFTSFRLVRPCATLLIFATGPFRTITSRQSPYSTPARAKKAMVPRS